MGIISGRFGSAQRLYPIQCKGVNGATKTIWQTLDPLALSDFGVNRPERAIPGTGDGGVKLNDATTISALRSWSLENTIQPIEFVASNTRGFKGKLPGLHECSGQFAGLGSLPPVFPGDRFKFLGYVGPDDGKIDSKIGTVYTVTAVATQVQIQINYQLSQPITWTVSWSSDWQEDGDELQFQSVKNLGTAGEGSVLGFWDYTNLECTSLLPSTTCNLQIFQDAYDGDTTVLENACLVDANIQFSTDVQEYSNSCSAKAGGWKSRVVGATNCSLQTQIQGNSYNVLNGKDSQGRDIHLPGTNHRVRIFVTSNEPTVSANDTAYTVGESCAEKNAYWEFDKMFFGGFQGLSVDTTSNNPLQFSCQMDFNPFPKIDGSCKTGYILYHDKTLNKYYQNGNVYLCSTDPEKKTVLNPN